MVVIRVATTVAAVLIYSFAVTANIFVIKDTQKASIEATTLRKQRWHITNGQAD